MPPRTVAVADWVEDRICFDMENQVSEYKRDDSRKQCEVTDEKGYNF
jgi:hypothetical protein